MKSTKNTRVPPIGRFIDPLTDFGFKRIFGSESNKDLLIAFLNELFKGRRVIKKLTYNPQENRGMEKGAEQKSYEFVKNLLAAGKFSISEIAGFANVTEGFVKK